MKLKHKANMAISESCQLILRMARKHLIIDG